jgi:flagellar protein FlaG
MAAQAASEMIFFIGSVIISAALVGVFFTSVSQIADSVASDAQNSAAQLESSITILNDPSHVAYNNTSGNFTLWVKNTGTRSLVANQTIILLDQFTLTSANYTATVAANVSTWAPQTTAVFQIFNLTLAPGQDHFLKVVAQNGASDTQEFYW